VPIYEFVCQRCQALTELLVKSREGHVEIRCPECGSTELQRVVSRVHSVVAGDSGPGTDSAAASPWNIDRVPPGIVPRLPCRDILVHPSVASQKYIYTVFSFSPANRRGIRMRSVAVPDLKDAFFMSG